MSAAVSVEESTGVEDQGPGAASTRPIMSQRQIMLVIYGLLGGMFLSALDQTIVGTAIRTIGDDLNGLDQQAWVTTAYLITSTITTPLYGKLSDLFGRRPLFIFGIGVFIAGSLLSSFSTSMLMLAGFRAFQGIGAGALMSLPLAIIGDMLAPRERARYQGYFLATFGIASVVGPLVGGVFAGASRILGIAGWRWVFLINVPVGIVALLMVMAFMHLPHIPHAAPRVDFWGATLVVVALGPLLLVAEQGRDWGWWSVASITCYVVGALGVAGFIIVENAMGADAIIPMRLFSADGFSMTVLLSVIVGFGMFGAMLTIPLYLQIVMGLSPTRAGLATLPMMLGLMISAIGTGQFVARTGHYRIFPRTGTATVSIGFLLLVFLKFDSPYWYLGLSMFVIGLGLGQLMQTLTMAAQAAAPARDMGVATSAATFFRQIGGTLGTAVLLSLLFGLLPGNIATAMGDRPDLSNALDAALDPSVANAPENRAVMAEIWTPVVSKVQSQVQTNLDQATAQANLEVEAKVRQQVSDAVHAQASKGAGKLASGAHSLGDGLTKLGAGTKSYVTGVGALGSGAQQVATGAQQAASAGGQLSTGAAKVSSGLGSVKTATNTAAASAKRATTDFAAVQQSMSALAKDQASCQSGTTASCGKLTADQAALQQQMKALGTSVYTTNGYLNGASGKPGIASGISELSSGASAVAQGSSRLATGLSQLSAGATKVSDGASTAAKSGSKLTQGVQASAAGSHKLGEGASKLSGVDKIIDQKVAEVLPGAQEKALAQVAAERHLSVVNSKLSVDYADPAQREAVVKEVVPTLAQNFDSGATMSKAKATTSDTSFLTGADPRLTKPFLQGFTTSGVSVFWVGLGVMLLAFVLTLFFRPPDLRTRSALQEKADLHKKALGADDVEETADTAGEADSPAGSHD